jgi:hypothetical protein
LLSRKCCKAIHNSFVNAVIISMILVHMLIYIYIYGLSYIDKVYINVIISNMEPANADELDALTQILAGHLSGVVVKQTKSCVQGTLTH